MWVELQKCWSQHFPYCHSVVTLFRSSLLKLRYHLRVSVSDFRKVPEPQKTFWNCFHRLSSSPCNGLPLLQTWKNETVAEQGKRSPKERPILLSKDIESKLALLDREVNYLLNKAKFTKPKPKAKAKNSTSSDKSGKANNNNTAEEKVIPPTEESTDTKSGGSNGETHMWIRKERENSEVW